MQTGFEQTSRILREQTGVVVPMYLPSGVDAGHGAALVADTVRGYRGIVSRSERVCVVVDGAAHGEQAGRAIASETGATLVVLPENGGKFRAAAAGMNRLLADSALKYLAVVDQDGDHFPNELANFVRTALHMGAVTGSDRLLVTGCRNSLHRPMGYLRGELEELVDRVYLDALQYRAAVAGVPLRMDFMTMHGEFIDIHSGYKLFSRRSAEDVFSGAPPMCGCEETCVFRHCVEVVMATEALDRGAVLGMVMRSTLNEQPISTFGLYSRDRLFADMMIWPCRRLGVPDNFVLQWFDNQAPRLLLNTLAPQGKEELAAVRRLLLEAFPGGAGVRNSEPLFV